MNGRKLRDAVHKDVELSAAEVRLVDTPQMQRLRGIRQLGAAYLVYPSANHTRFEHGLGTAWMARRILDRLEESDAVPPLHREAVCLASLVHDVTHIPFGHTFEDERRLLSRHDRSQTRFELLLSDTELGEALRSTEAGRLALGILDPDASMDPDRRHLRQIVSGTVCADLLDYLKRDNYFCGLSYEFDDRVFHYFRIVGGELALDLMQGGFFRRDALSEVTNLLRIRYVLSERVYYHHAKIAAGVMISKAIERAMACGLDETTLCRLTDGSLVWHLRERYSDDAPLLELLDAFERRRLFKRCYMLSRKVGEEAQKRLVQDYHLNVEGARDRVETRIADALGVPEHQVAVYCAPAGMALKEADVAVTGTDGLTRLSALNSDEIQVLKRQHRDLWKLYVFLSPDAGDRIGLAGEACGEAIGYPNELPDERRGRVV